MGNRSQSTVEGTGWRLRPLAAALVTVGGLVPGTACAATLTVTTLAESSPSACTLRDAVNSVNNQSDVGACAASGSYGSADTVVFASSVAGTITFASGDPLASPPFGSALEVRRSVSIDGPGSSVLTLTCGSTNFRLLEIDATAPSVSVAGLTIDRCSSSGAAGGGILANFSAASGARVLQLMDVALTNNQAATNGGGMAVLSNVGATVTMTACQVIGNVAGSGGGLWFSGAVTAQIAKSVINLNRGGAGGGMMANAAVQLDVADSTLMQNSAANGGALYAKGGSDVMFTRATIASNSANGGGALMLTADASVSVLDSTLSSNKAGGIGGAVQVAGNPIRGGGFTATNSTFSGNAAGKGGAIYVAGGPPGALNLANTTVANNRASIGGGIMVENTVPFGAITPANVVDIVDTIVAGNTPEDTLSNEPGLPGGVLPWNVSYSLIGVPADVPLVGTANITGGPPPFGAGGWLGPLQKNGGPTKTHALLTTVPDPAINAGDPLFSGLSFDQRGPPHVRVSDGRVDIGAYERGEQHPAMRPAPIPGPTHPALSFLSGLLAWLGWRLRPRR